MKEVLKMNEKQMETLGWIATFMSVMMYVSYIPQIMDNFSGQKGNFIQPLAVANAPGILFGLVTALTALL